MQWSSEKIEKNLSFIDATELKRTILAQLSWFFQFSETSKKNFLSMFWNSDNELIFEYERISLIFFRKKQEIFISYDQSKLDGLLV